MPCGWTPHLLAPWGGAVQDRAAGRGTKIAATSCHRVQGRLTAGNQTPAATTTGRKFPGTSRKRRGLHPIQGRPQPVFRKIPAKV